MKGPGFGPLAPVGDGPEPPDVPDCVCPGEKCCECVGEKRLCVCDTKEDDSGN